MPTASRITSRYRITAMAAGWATGSFDTLVRAAGPSGTTMSDQELPDPDPATWNEPVWDLSAEEPAPPEAGPVARPEPSSHVPHPDWVRFGLALGMMLAILILILVLAGVWGWLHGGSSDNMEALIAFMAPITTLAGAVFTFYFTDVRRTPGSRRRRGQSAR